MTCRTECRQRGAALIAAMLTVTLVAAFASTAAWQQWQAVEVEAAERTRVQAGWILVGALDWARVILMEDARAGAIDHLAEPWAVALQETRLSTFLAADKNNTPGSGAGDALDVFLSGRIEDMQSRMNVMNLVDAGEPSVPDVQAFDRLFNALGLPPSELQQLAASLRAASRSGPGGMADPQAALMPQRVGQLTGLGLSPATLARLEPYVSLLPLRTPLNLNTAGAEVLFASLPGVDMSQAQRLVQQRALKPLTGLEDAGRLMGAAVPLPDNRYSVGTAFFEVRGRLRMQGTVIEERSLLQRDGLQLRTLWRERAALPPPVAAARVSQLQFLMPVPGLPGQAGHA
ncbi:MAG: ral secretion pathway protein GspK [Polaromonas sp.]|nr:ral secretion pathway protein GspK [Polaromonas sp.]